jgi:hypothetical protein
MKNNYNPRHIARRPGPACTWSAQQGEKASRHDRSPPGVISLDRFLGQEKRGHTSRIPVSPH